MNRFVWFIKKIYVFVIFVFLEIAAMNYYANSTSYTKAKLLSATNVVAGGVYRQTAALDDYFGLRAENDRLVDRIAELSNELERYREAAPDIDLVTIRLEEGVGDYVYTTASVINNTLSRPENFITLDKGRRDGVEPNMAVITPEGTLVGYVLDCSERFSVAMSLLNIDFQTSGTIKGKEYLGSVFWDGVSNRYATLSEIEKYGDIAVGDTVVTTEYSSRFPPGVVIGTVDSYEMKQMAYYDVKVKLATRFGSLNRVLLVRYHDIVERMMLEENVAGES